MNSLKRICSILVSISLILGLFVGPLGLTAAAVPTSTITVSNEFGQPGETVDVLISVANNPGFCGFTIDLNYDSTCLTPATTVGDQGVEGGSVLSNGFFIINPNFAANKVRVAWFKMSDTNSNGEMFRYSFKIKDTAQYGTKGNISLNLSEIANLDTVNQLSKFTQQNGSITVVNPDAKALTSFSIGGRNATINETEKTISLELPYGADRSALTAVFAANAKSVKVGATDQVSGTTVNNFTAPVTYTLTAYNDTTANYTVTVTTRQTQSELTITGLTAQGKVYDGTAGVTVIGDPVLNGIVSGDTVSVSGTLAAAFADKNAGDNKNVPVTGFTLAGPDADNYTLTLPTLKANITKKALTVTAEDKSKIYKQENPAFTVLYNGFVLDEGKEVLTKEPTATCIATANSPEGTYPIVPDGAEAQNYSFTYVNGELAVSYAPVSSVVITSTGGALTQRLGGDMAQVNFEASKNESSDPNSPYEWRVNGQVQADQITNTFNFSPPNIAGTYAVTAKNGTITSSAITVEVTPKTVLTVTGLTANSKTYDGTTAATFTGAPVLSGDLPADDVELTGTAVGTFATKNAGDGIAVTLSGLTLTGADAKYYTLSLPTLEADISKATLTVTAENKSKTYKHENPLFTALITGYVGEDDASVLQSLPTFTCVADIDSDPGTYEIMPKGVLAVNYTMNYVKGTLTVSYAVVNNVQLTSVGQLTQRLGVMKPIAFTATANTGANPSLPVTWYVGADVQAESTRAFSYTPPSTVGMYTVKAVINGVESTVITVEVTEKTVVTISGLTAQSKEYDGNTLAALNGTPSLTGKEQGDAVTLEGTAIGTFADANCGTDKDVTITGLSLAGADASYYILDLSPLKANITKRMLTITAQNESKIYKQPNPEFTINYSGFIDEEDSNVLDTKPTVSCIATEDSTAGTYAIVVGGAADTNYSFTYVNGVLTVSYAPVTEVTLAVEGTLSQRLGGVVTPITFTASKDAASDPDAPYTWLVNGTPVNGATAATYVYTPSVAGIFNVSVSNSGHTSNVIVVTVKNPLIANFAFTQTTGLKEGESNVFTNATAGTFAAAGGDGSVYAYSFVADATDGADNGKFTIVGNALKVGANALVEGTYHINVKVLSGGEEETKAFTVTVLTPDPVSAPTASSASGSVLTKNASVSLFSETAGAVVYYTIDKTGGTPADPTAVSLTGVVALDTVGTTKIKAIAIRNGVKSPISTFTYTVNAISTLSNITITPGAYTFADTTNVTLPAYTDSASITPVLPAVNQGLAVAVAGTGVTAGQWTTGAIAVDTSSGSASVTLTVTNGAGSEKVYTVNFTVTVPSVTIAATEMQINLSSTGAALERAASISGATFADYDISFAFGTDGIISASFTNSKIAVVPLKIGSTILTMTLHPKAKGADASMDIQKAFNVTVADDNTLSVNAPVFTGAVLTAASGNTIKITQAVAGATLATFTSTINGATISTNTQGFVVENGVLKIESNLTPNTYTVNVLATDSKGRTSGIRGKTISFTVRALYSEKDLSSLSIAAKTITLNQTDKTGTIQFTADQCGNMVDISGATTSNYAKITAITGAGVTQQAVNAANATAKYTIQKAPTSQITITLTAENNTTVDYIISVVVDSYTVTTNEQTYSTFIGSPLQAAANYQDGRFVLPNELAATKATVNLFTSRTVHTVSNVKLSAEVTSGNGNNLQLLYKSAADSTQGSNVYYDIIRNAYGKTQGISTDTIFTAPNNTLDLYMIANGVANYTVKISLLNAADNSVLAYQTITITSYGGSTGGGTGGGTAGGSGGSGGGNVTITDTTQEVVASVTVAVPAVIGNTATSVITPSIVNTLDEKLNEQNTGARNIAAFEVPAVSEAGVKYEVTLTSGAVSEIMTSVADAVSIQTKTGSVEIDTDTLRNLTQSGGEVKLSIQEVSVPENSALRSVVGDRPVVEFNMSVNNEPVHDFGDNIKVSIPYTLQEGEDAGAIVVYYIDNSGNAVPVTGYYENGQVVIITNHFSKYAVAYKKVTFGDMDGHWANEYVTFMAARGIIGGVGSGQFAPDKNIKRGDFLKMLAGVAGFDYTSKQYATNKFKDIPSSHPYNGVIGWAIQAGIVGGYADGTFRPDDNITREDMAVMIARLMEYLNKTLPKKIAKVTFADESAISSYADSAVEVLQQAGIIGGKGDNLFAPKQNATRAEAAKMLTTLLKIIVG